MSEKKGFEASDSLQHIIAITPNNSCWHCERPLLFGFCGITARTPNGVFVFILCSATCQIQELIEAAACGYSAHTLGHSSVKAILNHYEDISAVIEGEWFLGGLLVKFCTKSISGAGVETN
jgi:hypothetical protein